MSENHTNQYEGMFLLSQTLSADLNAATDKVRAMIAKAGGDIIAMSKWDERRLAYEIKNQKRGMYLLVYFNCPAKNVAVIERECNLSEDVLRAMIIRADHLTEEEMTSTDGQQELATEAELRRKEAEAVEASAPEAETAAAGATEE